MANSKAITRQDSCSFNSSKLEIRNQPILRAALNFNYNTILCLFDNTWRSHNRRTASSERCLRYLIIVKLETLHTHAPPTSAESCPGNVATASSGDAVHVGLSLQKTLALVLSFRVPGIRQIHFQSRTIPLSGSSPSSLCAKAFVALKDATPSFSSLILDGERLYQCYTLSGIQRWNRNRSLTFAGVLPMKVTSLTSILLVVPPWVVSF